MDVDNKITDPTSVKLNKQCESYKELMIFKKSHRDIETIIEDIKKELMLIKEESFLVYIMYLILGLFTKDKSVLYSHLKSSLRQILYLIDLYYSIEVRNESAIMTGTFWNKISILLNEVEMTYFVKIGFNNNGELYHDDRDEKVYVSLPTFFSYFGNANLRYEEQTLDRIVRYFKPYDSYIKSKIGFAIDDALNFIFYVKKLNNDKYNDIFKSNCGTIMSYYEEFKPFIEKKGIINPHELMFQPELIPITTNIGKSHIHEYVDLLKVEIDKDSLQNILAFFNYDKDSLKKDDVIYYSDKRYSEYHPLIKVGNNYICLTNKFFIESLYFRIDEILTKSNDIKKYKQNKDSSFEKKVIEVFKDFFSEKTKIFTNYSVDDIAENDLLVIFENTCIIVEIKNCGFREPFRDPIIAYDRIKKDFKSSIQLGYDQCRRVELILLSGKNVDVIDAKNKHILYKLKNDNIKKIYNIVVTDYKYGTIQTDLSSLLQKEESALFPWSVCVDDLEVLFLLLKKKLKGITPVRRFIEFLNYREMLHGHIICDDELEICGWYLTDREHFKKTAENKDEKIGTSAHMRGIFDEHYYYGLGFKNELDIEYKKQYKLSDDPKHKKIKREFKTFF